MTKGVTGRPRKYETPEAFDAAVDKYVSRCEFNQQPVTWTGMALALGFADRSGIDEYQKYEGFSYSVKRAKSFVALSYEQRLSGNAPTGAIFALKNMGWSDKLDVNQSGDVTLNVVTGIARADD